MNKTCIVIGASHAACQLVISLRQQGWEDRIILIGEESEPPYQRPPLSKQFLKGELDLKDLFIRTPELYAKQNIETRFGERVTALHRDRQAVELDNGELLPYDKLVLCTGSVVRQLPIPGTNLAGVHTLRTLTDVEAIKQALDNGRRAVIIGGGYIGLETAAALRKMELEVTVLEMETRLLARVTAPQVSDFYHRLHTEAGVKIITGATATNIDGNGRVETVSYQSDGTTEQLDADLVIIGVGVLPNQALAESAGLALDNGIVVDEFAQTSDPNILAAGDCTNHPNPLYGRLRLESVPNAVEQAKCAALTLCGKPKPYDSLPWFWSDQYHIKMQIAGINRGYESLVVRGDPDTDAFSVFYLKGNRLIAADCVNHPQDFLVAKRLIGKQAAVSPDTLGDTAVDIKSLLKA